MRGLGRHFLQRGPKRLGSRRRAGVARFRTLLFVISLAVATAPILSGTNVFAQTPASPLSGTWTGVLGGRLHLIVTISTSSSGGYEGVLNSVDQSATLALSKISLSGDTVRFEVPSVGGVYEGALERNGQLISGSWVQASTISQPLYLQRTAGPVAPVPALQASPARTPQPRLAAFNAVPSITPQAFKADGKWHIVYELHISNMDKRDYRFTHIDVVSGDDPRKALASFSGNDLDAMFEHPGIPSAEKVSKLVPGEFGVVYMWVNFDHPEDIPASIAHRFNVRIGDYLDEISETTPPMAVDRDPVAVVAPPLVGDNWVAANGPSNTSAHRTTVISIDGHAYDSQRFAIDWVQLYPDGKTYKGDPLDNKNYRAYGQEIHSVADGIVTQIKDGIPQNVPNAKTLAVEITLETVGGNHVIVDIGNGRYAFYAHMQPGSIRVKVGDKVTRGQVLGVLGNTGNSSEPHLHFQICNRSSELGCEGLPYALPSFDVQGKGENWKSSDPHPSPTKHEMEIPTEDEIIAFPAPMR